MLTRVDDRLRAVSVEPRMEGANSSVFEVGCDDGERLIVKLFTDRFEWQRLQELHAYGFLAKHPGLPVPRVLGADDSKSVMPWNTIVMTAIDGELLRHVLDRMSESEIEELYGEIGSILAELHRIRFEQFGHVTKEVIGPHATNLALMREKFRRNLDEFERLGGSSRLRGRIERRLAEREMLLEHVSHAVLCHNDFHDGNLIVAHDGDRWRVRGLIDFANVLAGDPLLDLAKVQYHSRRSSKRTLDALLAGYGEPPRPGWNEVFELYTIHHALEFWIWSAQLGYHGSLRGINRDIRRELRNDSLRGFESRPRIAKIRAALK